MQLRRIVGLVDLGIVVVLAVAVLLPPREMFARAAVKGDDAQQFALALAEAHTIARPDDGRAVDDVVRKLDQAGMKDWAIELAVRASDRAKDSPTRWRALLATSVAYVDELDVVPALDYANRALAECDAARSRGDVTACPPADEIKARLYQQHLDAGVKSGIDPHVDPEGFRRAGEAALRSIHIGATHDDVRGSAAAGSSAPTAP